MADVRVIATLIMNLTANELVELNKILGDDFDLGGVREPREPAPESPGDAVAVDLPEDYWETAQ